VSALLAGLAGALYVPQVGIITPAKIGVLPSIEMIIWVAVGGRGTLVGPVIGAFGVNWLQSILTTSYPDLWLLVLGGLFVGVVLFFPTASSELAERSCHGCSDPRRAPGRRPSTLPTLARFQKGNGGMTTAGSAQGSIIYLEDVTSIFDGFKRCTT